MPSFSLQALLDQLLYDPKNPLLFNNGFFVYFFAIFIGLYYGLRNNFRGRMYLMCIFSLYFFYKASGMLDVHILGHVYKIPFVTLVLVSAVIDYVVANLIYRQTEQVYKKALVVISVVFNLGMLCCFKYTDFFIGLTNDIFTTHFSLLHIALPIGISFYTFENLSYTIDVYRGEFVPEKKFGNYLLFLSFFPKLVMGPIVRAKDFIPQLYKPYTVSSEDFSKGFYLIFSGLFKKLVISDYITTNFVNYIFDGPSLHTGLECLVAVYGYAIVIYCDFSGYSDVAIGMAKWLGITIPPNFLSPYQSKTITEFWRRWHISLSSWLRDYLYIPLGGSRKGKFRTYLNLFLTMVLGGFWHGASWNFIIWGAMHGGALAIHKVWMKQTGKRWEAFNNTPVYNFFSWFITFQLVCFCWIFFKSADFNTAGQMLNQIANHFSLSVWSEFYANYHNVLWMMALGFALHFIPDSVPDKVVNGLQRMPMPAYIVIFIAFMIAYAVFKSSEPVMPIYLQF